MTEQKRVEVGLRRDIDALIDQAKPRNPHHLNNQERVASLACALGEKPSLNVQTLRGLRMAAMLHDIGMVMIPQDMVDKPDKLSEEEFSLLRQHPQAGFDMLQHINFPWPVAEIVLQHHEHFDGSGYPNGLTEWEILDEARILLVADVVEAITTERPYRAASSLKDAVWEIANKSGTLYDPDVVDALTQLASSGQLTTGGSSWE